MAVTHVKYFPQLYLGIQQNAPLSTETFPLGFATPYTQDSAFEGRKDTVDRWVRGYHYKDAVTSHIIDNVPMEGFTFDKVVSRYTTSNKWFTIFDPRGFSLQISSANLGDILLNNSIVKGELIGKFVWTRSGSNNYLVAEDHPIYQEAVNPSIERTKLQLGDVALIGGVMMTYLGEFYAEEYEYTTRTFRTDTMELYGKYDVPTVTRHVMVVGPKRHPKPVFMFVWTDDKGVPHYTMKNSKPRNPMIRKENQPYEVLPIGVPIQYNQLSYIRLHETKADLLKTPMEWDVVNEHMNAYLAMMLEKRPDKDDRNFYANYYAPLMNVRVSRGY